MRAARAEMLETLGSAFDPTVPGWPRLQLIDPGLRLFMTQAIDPAAEQSSDLNAYAEQILAIVGLEIDPLTPDVLLEIGRNLTAELATHRQRELSMRGMSPDESADLAFADSLAVTRRFLASTQMQAPVAAAIHGEGSSAETRGATGGEGDRPSPCGNYHRLSGAELNERVGGADMTRYCVVAEVVAGTVEAHSRTNEHSINMSDEELIALDVGTRLRYDQLDYTVMRTVGWHRFQILSGPHAGECVRLDGPDMGMGDYSYIPDMPYEVDPVEAALGEWEAEAGLTLLEESGTGT